MSIQNKALTVTFFWFLQMSKLRLKTTPTFALEKQTCLVWKQTRFILTLPVAGAVALTTWHWNIGVTVLVMQMHNFNARVIITKMYLWHESPSIEIRLHVYIHLSYPSSLQITSPLIVSKSLSHILPQTPLLQTSIRPSWSIFPSTKRIAPSVQLEGSI